MPFRKIIAIFVLFFLARYTVFSHADEMRYANTQQGTSVELSRIHYWNKVCAAVPVSANLVVEPKHGEVRFQKINSTIGNFGGGRLMTGSVQECIGLPIEAIQVVYIPMNGFTGSDQFTLNGGPGNGFNKTIAWRIQVE